LNAIANAVTRQEGLIGILDEIAVVCENINELVAEEAKSADATNDTRPSPEKSQDCGSCSG